MQRAFNSYLPDVPWRAWILGGPRLVLGLYLHQPFIRTRLNMFERNGFMLVRTVRPVSVAAHNIWFVSALVSVHVLVQVIL